MFVNYKHIYRNVSLIIIRMKIISRDIQNIIDSLKPSIPDGWNKRTWQETITLDQNLQIILNTPIKENLIRSREKRPLKLICRYNGITDRFEVSERSILKFIDRCQNL